MKTLCVPKKRRKDVWWTTLVHLCHSQESTPPEPKPSVIAIKLGSHSNGLLMSWQMYMVQFKAEGTPLQTLTQRCIESWESPGWYGSVDWVPVCEPNGCQFNSQSGHMPGLWARSPVGDAQEATTHWCFSPSLSPSLPLSLKINKLNLKKKKESWENAG